MAVNDTPPAPKRRGRPRKPSPGSKKHKARTKPLLEPEKPTRFRFEPHHVELACQAFRSGADEALAAHVIGCSLRSLEDLIACDAVVYDRFREAKRQADSVVVASLYKRAIGTVQKDPETGKKTIVVPGDLGAQIFWLKNRQSDEWRDRHEFTMAAKSAAERVAEEVGISVDDLMAEAQAIAKSEKPLWKRSAK